MSNYDGFGAFVRALMPSLLLLAVSGAAPACSSDTGDDDAAGGSGGTASGGSSGSSGSPSGYEVRCDSFCYDLTGARCGDFDAVACHKSCPVVARLATMNICKAEYEADLNCGLALPRADICRYTANDATALCVSEGNAASACYKSYCASNSSSPNCPH